MFIIILLVIVVLIVGMSLLMVSKNKKTPENLGVNGGKLSPLPSSPNAVSSQTDIEEKFVEPFPFQGSLEESKLIILEILKQYGNVEVITTSHQYIHAINTTKQMKYRDDIEFYFDENEKKIHFRSASRIGYSDMGLNKARYNKIRKLYDSQ